ncbi:MAG: MBL fold metallo-hydrolase [bacterium]|nr:MBL fold metallo-hydrolase [bacterium]
MAEAIVRVLGSGNAFCEGGRGFAGLWILTESDGAFLVDVGPSAMMGLAGVAEDLVRSTDRLFLTHLHGDHVAGWPFWLLHAHFRHRRRQPFDVFGPPGTQRVLEGLVDLCYPELLGEPRFEIRYHEWPLEQRDAVATGRGLSVDAIPMQHHATSLGLRFRFDGRRVAVSGDTSWCAGLERLADDCDALILECSQLHPVPEVSHVSLEELRAGVDRLRAKRIVLVHLGDGVSERLAADPLPRVTVAHDGMELSV